MDVGLWPRELEHLRNLDDSVDFVAAKLSGGDSRVAVDPHTCLNKYLCPTLPAPDLICASSCTASPISDRGFLRSANAFSDIVLLTSPRQRARRLINTDQRNRSQAAAIFRCRRVGAGKTVCVRH